MTSISGATDIGTLDQAIAGAQLVKQTIAQLTAETSSGYLSNDYAGLGTNAGVALNLSTQLLANQADSSNANSAANIQQVAQTALQQISALASSFASNAASLETIPNSISTVAAQAQDALQQVANLLDTQVGGVYVFAGQDSNDPPVPNPNQITASNFYTAIQTAIAGLTTNGAAATTAATLAIAAPGGTSPFSPTLDAAGQIASVDLGGGQQVALAPLANANANASSTGVGTTSTGSYTRDILLSLASLGSLTAGQSGNANFLPLVQSTVTTLQGAIGAISTDIGALGDRQDQITDAQSVLSATNTALLTQLGNVQDADLTQVSAQLSQAQTQLQASYQIIASLSQLSLAKYI
jgi:flagellar hook-associated protein 3 FlgL